jgi:spore maturation protein CgeB
MDRGDLPPGDPRSMWLPLGYDDALYHPTDASRDIDILFIGQIGKLYSRRQAYLQRLSRSPLTRNWRVAFIGTTGTRLFDRGVRLGSGLEWVAKRLPEAEFARYIARSRICVNILQDDGIEPVNPTFFAIPATGACQVTERRAHLSSWLKPGVEYVDFERDHFLETLEALLGDSARCAMVSDRGQQAVVGRHTYVHRIRTILERLNLEARSAGSPAPVRREPVRGAAAGSG